jgi:nitrogen regulatory protein P-II 1
MGVNEPFMDPKPLRARAADTFFLHATRREAFGAMKKIEAIIKPFKVDDVKARVFAAGGKGMTMSEVKGFGRTGGKKEVYRGSAYVVDFVPKVRIQLFVDDDQVPSMIDAIVGAARTGEIGDGKITITSLEEVVRIRTGERGKDAL